jgi:probable addiction module antidote protein
MMTQKLETFPFDPVEYLTLDQDQLSYLQTVFEEGDPSAIAIALGHVARARGMTQMAQDTGISRAGLYKALSADGSPSLATALVTLKALGLKMSVDKVEAA